MQTIAQKRGEAIADGVIVLCLNALRRDSLLGKPRRGGSSDGRVGEWTSRSILHIEQKDPLSHRFLRRVTSRWRARIGVHERCRKWLARPDTRTTRARGHRHVSWNVPLERCHGLAATRPEYVSCIRGGSNINTRMTLVVSHGCLFQRIPSTWSRRAVRRRVLKVCGANGEQCYWAVFSNRHPIACQGH